MLIQANREPGAPLEGKLLEQWCENASRDERDWYTPEERHQHCLAYARRVEQARQRPQGRMPIAIVIIEGDVGEGKSALANYTCALQGARTGGQTYHSGPFGYGRVLTPEEWFTSFNEVRKGSSVFIDEASNASRKGRDNADIQSILNQQGTVVRKQESLGLFASAMAEEMGSVLRGRADYIWRPRKRRLVLSDDDKERLRRRGRGRGGRGKSNPANFAYERYTVKDRPYRKGSLFDRALNMERDEKGGQPVYRKPLSVRWMRRVMPLLDTFQKVPIAAALGVNRQDVIDLSLGRAPAPKELHQAQAVGWLAMAFNQGRLAIPPIPPSGLTYHPTYMTPSAILNATDCELGLTKFSAVLRGYLNLTRHGNKGYELLELYEAVMDAMTELGPTLDSLLAGDDADADAALGQS